MRKALVSILLLFTITCTVRCTGSATVSPKEEFADAFLNYATEVILADKIATESLNHAADLVRTGEINTREFEIRCYQITLIHAYTLVFIDSKPEYEILFPWLCEPFDKDAPPKLGFVVPPELSKDPDAAQIQNESYLEDYIWLHDRLLERAVERIGPPKGK